jgi:outer membrane lipoprotein carrier protein
MIQVLRVFFGLLVIGAQAPGAGPSPPPAAELARALQRKYDAIHDFSAGFVHTYEGGVLRKRATERGTVLIKKPGKMRWTYTAPEQKLFVSDGRKVYSYIPEDKQVIVSAVPAGDQATTPALFLAGKGDLSRDFTPSLTEVPGAPARTYALKLTPKKSDLEYDWLTLVIDRESLQIRMLVTLDPQGGRSTFTFTNLKENQGLPDKEFVFKVPRGVDVITDDRSAD